MSGSLAEQIYRALCLGAFPMAPDKNSHTIHLIEPHQRTILPLRPFRLPRRLARRIRQHPYQIKFDTAFAATMRACAGRAESWISPPILDAYQTLHSQGRAHSVECWHEGALIGGLYGVVVGAAFFGESMFSHSRDASKIALAWLAARLTAGGFVLLDAQFMTDHLRQFGALEVPHQRFRELLAQARHIPAQFDSPSAPKNPEEVLHFTGQIS